MKAESIVVVGASAGGLAPLREFVQSLPADFGAATLIVRHFPPTATSELPSILGRGAELPVVEATHGAQIERGHIYTCMPGLHLIVVDGRMELQPGPRINSFRPSIDTLFRSAAREFGNRTAGIVLSGTLDDGTAGLLSIHRRGGLTIVQEPAEAEYSDMPLSVLKHFAADHVLPAAAMGKVLVDFVNGTNEGAGAMSDAIDRATELANHDLQLQADDRRRGDQSTFTCPECGGVLWQIDDEGPPSFRCHVGHMYGGERLINEHMNVVERSIWYTMRSLKDLVLLSRQLANYARQDDRLDVAQTFEIRSRQAEKQLAELEAVILRSDDLRKSG